MKDKLIDFRSSATRPLALLGMIRTTPVVHQTLSTAYCRPSALPIADPQYCLLQTLSTAYCRPSALPIGDPPHCLLQTLHTAYCRPSAPLPIADSRPHCLLQTLDTACCRPSALSIADPRAPLGMIRTTPAVHRKESCHMPNHGSNLVESLGRKNADLF